MKAAKHKKTNNGTKKKSTLPAIDKFDDLIKKARKTAKQVGLKKADVEMAVKTARDCQKT